VAVSYAIVVEDIPEYLAAEIIGSYPQRQHTRLTISFSLATECRALCGIAIHIFGNEIPVLDLEATNEADVAARRTSTHMILSPRDACVQQLTLDARRFDMGPRPAVAT